MAAILKHLTGFTKLAKSRMLYRRHWRGFPRLTMKEDEDEDNSLLEITWNFQAVLWIWQCLVDDIIPTNNIKLIWRQLLFFRCIVVCPPLSYWTSRAMTTMKEVTAMTQLYKCPKCKYEVSSKNRRNGNIPRQTHIGPSINCTKPLLLVFT